MPVAPLGMQCLRQHTHSHATHNRHPRTAPPRKTRLQETKAVFEKLHKYLGKAIRALVERPDEEHVLRLHRNRVYYVRADLMRKATNVSRPSVGGGEDACGGTQRPRLAPTLAALSPCSTPLLHEPIRTHISRAGRPRQAGPPGAVHRQADALWQVPADGRLTRLAGPARQVQGEGGGWSEQSECTCVRHDLTLPAGFLFLFLILGGGAFP